MSALAAQLVQSDYYWFILFAGNLPIFYFTGYAFFDSWRGLFASIFYMLKPDSMSLIDGEWQDDRIETVRMGYFLFTCAALIISEHLFLQSHFAQAVP